MFKTLALANLASAAYRKWGLSELMLEFQPDTSTVTAGDLVSTNCLGEGESPIYARYWRFFDSDITWSEHPDCPCTYVDTFEGDAIWDATFDAKYLVNNVQLLSNDDADDLVDLSYVEAVLGEYADADTYEVFDYFGLAANDATYYTLYTSGDVQESSSAWLGLESDFIRLTNTAPFQFCDIIVEGYPAIAEYVAELDAALLDLSTYGDDAALYQGDLTDAYNALKGDYETLQDELTALDSAYTDLLDDYAASVADKELKQGFIGVYESRKLKNSCLYCAPGGCQFCSTPEVVTEADLEEEEEEEE